MCGTFTDRAGPRAGWFWPRTDLGQLSPGGQRSAPGTRCIPAAKVHEPSFPQTERVRAGESSGCCWVFQDRVFQTVVSRRMPRKGQEKRPNSNPQEDPNKPSEKVIGFSAWIPLSSVKWMKLAVIFKVLFLCASDQINFFVHHAKWINFWWYLTQKSLYSGDYEIFWRYTFISHQTMKGT